MNNPKTTAACAGATCAVGLAWGPTAIPLATAISKQIGIPACLATGAVCGVEAQRKFGQKVLNKQYIALSYLCRALEFDKPHDLDLGGQQLQQRLRHHRVIIILCFIVYC